MNPLFLISHIWEKTFQRFIAQIFCWNVIAQKTFLINRWDSKRNRNDERGLTNISQLKHLNPWRDEVGLPSSNSCHVHAFFFTFYHFMCFFFFFFHPLLSYPLLSLDQNTVPFKRLQLNGSITVAPKSAYIQKCHLITIILLKWAFMKLFTGVCPMSMSRWFIGRGNMTYEINFSNLFLPSCNQWRGIVPFHRNFES